MTSATAACRGHRLRIHRQHAHRRGRRARRGRRGRCVGPSARSVRTPSPSGGESPASPTTGSRCAPSPTSTSSIIGTPNALHAEQAIHALDHGKHVLVDKPMATTVADADRMIEAAQRAERTLAVGHMWRYHPDVIALRDRIAAGRVRADRAHPWLGRARRLGAVGVVHRSGTRRRRRTDRHGDPRDRHRPLPAGRP